MSDLKILTSHPIQYHVPFFREIIAAGLDIEVGYYHQGTAGRVAHDAEFGLDIKWDVDLLDGYPYRIFAGGQASYRRSEQLRVAPKLLSWALHDRKTPLLLVGWFVEVIWLLWLARILSQAPTIVISETTPLSFAATYRPTWRASLLRWLWQHTTAGLCIGHRNRTFLLQMGIPGERIFQAPYSIDNAHLATEVNRLLPRRTELCDQYHLDPEQPVFLFCGKLIPKKRPLQLLDAFLAAGLAQQAQLLYVGDGQLRSELEERIQATGLKQVRLMGFLNQSQMPLAYVLGQLLCLVSGPTETWGIVVNEALACGRPVIVSDTVGCAPDLVGRENGWVTPVDNPDRLAQTLVHAFNRRSEWTRMGEMGQKKVAGHTFEAMVGGVKSALAAIEG